MIGKYTIVKRIGTGTFGQVYLATHGSQQVALKQLKWSKQTLLAKVPFFAREIQIMKSLSHKHIVQFIEQFQLNDKVYIVSEYCSNGELAKFASSTALTLEEIVRVTRGMISGLEYIHRAGYMHRDLKPENIFIDEEWTIKIGDYGLGKKYEEGVRNTRMVGTPIYTPPNILQGSDQYTQKCDVFSIGLIIYHLLFRRHLFEDAHNFFGIMSLQRKLQRRNLDAFVNDLECDSRFKPILKNTLAYQEQFRMTSAELAVLFDRLFPKADEEQRVKKESLEKVQMYFMEVRERMVEVDGYLAVGSRLQGLELPVDRARVNILSFLAVGVYVSCLTKIRNQCSQQSLQVMNNPIYWSTIPLLQPIRSAFLVTLSQTLTSCTQTLLKCLQKSKAEARKLSYLIPDSIYQLFMEAEDGSENWVKFKKEFRSFYEKEVRVQERELDAKGREVLGMIRKILN